MTVRNFDQLQKLGRKVAGKDDAPPPQMLKGQVTAVDVATNTCSVKIGGAATTIAGIKFLAAYWPQPNDYVYCWQNGPDIFVVDKLFSGATPWHVIGGTNEPAFVNGWTALAGTTVSYKRIGEVVFLNGRLTVGAGGPNTVAFTLPLGYRPLINSWFAGYNQCEWYVENNGVVVPITAAGGTYSLSGSWPVWT